MKKFMSEFKTFATKGNVLDLAIGVVIGSAFGAITNALVASVIMPFVGLFIGGINLENWVINIPNFIYGGEPIALSIGLFLKAVLDFIIIAFVLFLVVRAVNKGRERRAAKEAAAKAAEEKEEAKEEPKLTMEQELLTEIRDLLKNKEK